MGKSRERFRFGDGGPMATKMTVQVPFKIKDMLGEDKTINFKVYVVDAKVPLLIGKDTHQSLNICTTPASSTCQLGLHSERSTYNLKTTPGRHWSIEFQDISKEIDNTDDIVDDTGSEEINTAESKACIVLQTINRPET